MLPKPRSAFTMRGSGLLCSSEAAARLAPYLTQRTARRDGRGRRALLRIPLNNGSVSRGDTGGERRDTDTRLLAPSAPTVLAWTIAPARPPARLCFFTTDATWTAAMFESARNIIRCIKQTRRRRCDEGSEPRRTQPRQGSPQRLRSHPRVSA
jgi:hypothetical protein